MIESVNLQSKSGPSDRALGTSETLPGCNPVSEDARSAGSDGRPPGYRGSGRGNVSTLLWSSEETPAEIWSAEDFGARTLGTQPPPRGSRFCIIDYPPGTPGRMHRTETLDFIVCLAGGIDMEMDDGLIIHLGAGDVMVQQGTNHSWINNGTETCRLAIALLDAKRKG